MLRKAISLNYDGRVGSAFAPRLRDHGFESPLVPNLIRLKKALSLMAEDYGLWVMSRPLSIDLSYMAVINNLTLWLASNLLKHYNDVRVIIQG